MILKELNAYFLCDAIKKNKDVLKEMHIQLFKNRLTGKLKVQVFINENKENEIILLSNTYEETATKYLMKLCESVKEAYTNKEEYDELPF